MNAEQEAEFSAFAAARWTAWVRSAVFLGCETTEAHDVAQEALVRCYRHWGKVQRADDIDGYAFRILVNAYRDARRRRRWREETASVVPDTYVHDSAETIVRADAVQRALDELTDPHRQVLVLRYFVHLDEKQTAQALDIPLGTVKSRLSRALAAMATSPHLADIAEQNQQKGADR